ncbi:tripartite tricarboxylate transporter substrate binding protein [Paracidovorax wautersii]|uniref:Bug family tripartite tricarboxylate transporter substrate binding protein n=1 Tax=Paracidovorax wautersii TaxID=1177982 RepID=UPI0031DB19C0
MPIALRRIAALAACTLVFSSFGAGASDAYPSKPIRLVIGFGAGGITDVAGRLVAKALGEELQQQVVVDNRPGAGSSIAATAVAQAPADGYTLLLGTVGTQVVNKMIYRKLSYDPSSLTPVSLVSNSPFVLAVSNSVQAGTLRELLSLTKAQPGKLNFGSAGNGSSPHLCLELLKISSGIDLVHVPFKSGAEAVNAVVSGQVDVTCDAITVIDPQAKAGRLKMLAVAAGKRNTEIPNVPTGAEQGVAAFQVGSWNALLGPAGMPAETVQVLNRALAKVMDRPAVRQQLASMGIEVLPLGVQAYATQLKAETEKWGKVIEAAGTKLD